MQGQSKPAERAERTATKRMPLNPYKMNSTVNISDLKPGDTPIIINMDTSLCNKRSIRDGFVVDYTVQKYVQDITKNKKLGINKLKLIASATSQDLSVDVHAFLAYATLIDGTEKIAVIASVLYPDEEDDRWAISLFEKDYFYNIESTFGCNFSIVGISSVSTKDESTYQGRTTTINKFTHSIAVNVNYNLPLTDAEKGILVTKPIFILSENSDIKINDVVRPQYSLNRAVSIGTCDMKTPVTSSGIKFSPTTRCRYELFKIPNLNITVFAFDSTIDAGKETTSTSGEKGTFLSWIDMSGVAGDKITFANAIWNQNIGHVISVVNPADPTTYKYVGFLSEEEYLLSAHSANSIPLLVSNKNVYKLVQSPETQTLTYVIESIIEKVYPIGPAVMVGNTLFIIGVNGIYRASVRDSLFNVEELATKISNDFFLCIKNNLRSIEYVDSYFDAENSKVVFVLNMNSPWLDRLYYHLGIQGQSTTEKKDNEENLIGLNIQSKTILISIAVDAKEGDEKINIHSTALRFKGKLSNFGGYVTRETTGYDVANFRNPALFNDLDYSVNKNLINTFIHDRYSFIDEDFLVYHSVKQCNQDATYPFYVIYGLNLTGAFKDAHSEMKSVTITAIDVIFSSRINLKSESGNDGSEYEKLKEKITCVLIEHEESIMDISREMIVKKTFLPKELILEPLGEYQLINKLRVPIKEMLLSGTMYIAFQSEIFSTLVSAYINYHVNMF